MFTLKRQLTLRHAHINIKYLKIKYQYNDFKYNPIFVAQSGRYRYLGKIPFVFGVSKLLRNFAYSGPLSNSVSLPIFGPFFSYGEKKKILF